MKKNNKGFSLVELIVVVLIMGIIAVALAPQVMKWVQKARDNGDANTAKDLKSAFNTAIADCIGDPNGSAKVTATTSATAINSSIKATGSNVFGDLDPYIYEVLGGDFPKKSDGSDFTAMITETKSGSGSWKVEIK